MQTFLEITLSNAVVATVLALVAAVIGRVCRRPALVHSLWLLVLLKLVTPPLVPVSLSWLGALEVPALASNPSPPQGEPLADSQPRESSASSPRGQATWTEPRPHPDSAVDHWILIPVESSGESTEPLPAQTVSLAEVVSAWLRSPIWEVVLPL